MEDVEAAKPEVSFCPRAGRPDPPKTLNDQSAKVAQSTVGNVSDEPEEEEEPLISR